MDKQADPHSAQPELGTSPEEAALRTDAAGTGAADVGESSLPDAGPTAVPQGQSQEQSEVQEKEVLRTSETAPSATDAVAAETDESEETATAENEAAGEEAGMQWYVLKVQSNREKSIKQALERRIRREGLEDYFGEIIIPTEKVVETKGGRKRIVERKLYPGYIMIQMKLTDDTWYLVRGTNGVGDFTGAAGKPIAMEEQEIERMLGKEREREVEPAKVKIDLSLGEMVKIKGGGFDSFEGTIDAIDEASGKITVLVEIFGRSTPVQLEHSQVERI